MNSYRKPAAALVDAGPFVKTSKESGKLCEM